MNAQNHCHKTTGGIVYEKELENLKKLLLQDGKKEDIPPLPEEETTEETPVFTLNNNALKLKKEKKTKKSKSKNKK